MAPTSSAPQACFVSPSQKDSYPASVTTLATTLPTLNKTQKQISHCWTHNHLRLFGLLLIYHQLFTCQLVSSSWITSKFGSLKNIINLQIIHLLHSSFYNLPDCCPWVIKCAISILVLVQDLTLLLVLHTKYWPYVKTEFSRQMPHRPSITKQTSYPSVIP